MEEDDRLVIPIETYTEVWQGKKKLYTLWDFQLPFPLPVLAIAVGAGTALLWMPILYVLGVPFSFPLGFVIYLSLPVGLGLMAEKEIFEKKSLPNFLVSQINFLTEGKQYDDARKISNPDSDTSIVETEVWISLADTYPAPRKKPKKQKNRKPEKPPKGKKVKNKD